MKKKIIVALAAGLMLGLYSFSLPNKGNQNQKFDSYIDENGDTVFLLNPGETFQADGEEINNSTPIQQKWVLCPGDGATCSGEIRTPGGVVIVYNSSKTAGEKNIAWVPDPH